MRILELVVSKNYKFEVKDFIPGMYFHQIDHAHQGSLISFLLHFNSFINLKFLLSNSEADLNSLLKEALERYLHEKGEQEKTK